MKKINISQRVFFTMLFLGVAFLIVFANLYIIKAKERKVIFEGARAQFNHEITSVISFPAQTLNKVAFDYTFWDEFVEYLHKTDSLWYESNITSILSSYNFNYVCVFDSSFNLIHEASTDDRNVSKLIPTEVFPTIKENRFAYFFVKTPQGLFEVSGASVHPTSDMSHKGTEPSGYLFIAKHWNGEMLKKLSEMTGSQTYLSDTSEVGLNTDPNTLVISRKLIGWNGIPVHYITFIRKYEVLKLYSEASNITAAIFLLFAFLVIITLILMLRYWIRKPLQLVENILNTEDPKSIDLLKKSPGEFGQIGELIEKYVLQKRDLHIAKDHAEKSDKLKTEFLCNMSHEIRTPMNGIIGFAGLLNDGNLTDAERQTYTNIVINNSHQLLRVIDDILEISSLETKQIKIQNTKTNVNILLYDLFAIFNLRAKEKKLNLVLKNELSQPDSNILIDQSKLLKVLNNLIENALKFTTEGFIEIGCRKEADFLHFSVRDTGIGIEKEKIEKIFHRFSQADEAIAYNYGGLGLGLAIANENAELLGGKITVDSKPGTGSLFTCIIPYTAFKEEETAKKLPENDPLSLKEKTILIAEDENSNFLYLKAILSKINPDFRIQHALDGQQAIEQCLVDSTVDIVLMDIKMPIKDGYEATKIIKEFRPKLPIIAQTAYSTPEEKNKALTAGCDDYLSKPLNIELLKSKLSKYLIT